MDSKTDKSDASSISSLKNDASSSKNSQFSTDSSLKVYTTASNTITESSTSDGASRSTDSKREVIKYIDFDITDASMTTDVSIAIDDVAGFAIEFTSEGIAKESKALSQLVASAPYVSLDEINAANRVELHISAKNLEEMGIAPIKDNDWESIAQPPKRKLTDLLRDFYTKCKKPNLQIVIHGVVFGVHLEVLQCYSDFFKEISTKTSLVKLPKDHVTPGAFVMMYEWMLANNPLIPRKGIVELLKAATFLRVNVLAEQCWVCLDNPDCIREDTAFFVYLDARRVGMQTLQDVMMMRIRKFFLTLVASQEFVDLDAKEVCHLLSSSILGVHSEVEVFMSAVRWLNKYWSIRKICTVNVMKCVRFGLMPPLFLSSLNRRLDCVQVDRIVSQPEVESMITDALCLSTVQTFYNGSSELLEQHKLKAPQQRHWILEADAVYHDYVDCPYIHGMTFEEFEDFLKVVQIKGKGYWHTLKLSEGPLKPMQACGRCRLVKDGPNAVSDNAKSDADDTKYGSDKTDYGSDKADYGSDKTEYGSDKAEYGSDTTKSDSVDCKFGSDNTEYDSDNTKSDWDNTKFDWDNTKSVSVDTKSVSVNTESDYAKFDWDNTKSVSVNTKSVSVNTESASGDTKYDSDNTTSVSVNTKADSDNAKCYSDNTKSDYRNTL